MTDKIEEFLLLYPGFGASAGVSHVIRSVDGRPHVLVGDPEDNPGTSVTNALERVASTVSDHLLSGERDFDLYEFVPAGPLGVGPTFFKIEWEGGTPFSMPTWHKVDPSADRWLANVRHLLPADHYSVQRLRERQGVVVVDGRQERRSTDPLAWLFR